MDGFEQNSGVIVIAATNFPESLDHALTRPGRFDKRVVVPLPDVRGREAILELYGSRTKLDASADLRQLAQGTPGMSGADLFNLVNQVRPPPPRARLLPGASPGSVLGGRRPLVPPVAVLLQRPWDLAPRSPLPAPRHASIFLLSMSFFIGGSCRFVVVYPSLVSVCVCLSLESVCLGFLALVVAWID